MSIFSCAMTLSGCISKEPNDIKFVSVQSVDAYLHPELDVNSRGYRGTHHNLIMVEFYTATDILDYADRNGVTAGIWSFFCDEGDDNPDLGLTPIYRNGREIVRHYKDDNAVNLPSSEALAPYYMFLDPVAIREELASKYSYDKALEKTGPAGLGRKFNNKDVCFRLKGGNEIGGFESNIVKIPSVLLYREL